MSILQWDASFSVNNEELDEQHRRWFEMLNKLHEAMLNENSDDLVQAKAESLQAMVDYTKFHFGAEEAYMRKINYPEIAGHLKLHQRFIDQLDELSEDFRAGRVLLGTRVIKLMQEWLKEHIASEDKKYAAWRH